LSKCEEDDPRRMELLKVVLARESISFGVQCGIEFVVFGGGREEREKRRSNGDRH